MTCPRPRAARSSLTTPSICNGGKRGADSVIGLSFPEAIILRKVLKLPLIFAFFGVVAAGIMVVGFLFNAIL